MSGYPPYVLYQDQLASVGFGTPLWNPILDNGRVKIGDVGFMRNGSFARLLRATASPVQLEELGDSAPAGFEQLQLSESDTQINTRISYPIYSTTMVSRAISGGASAGSLPVSEVTGASINFEISQGKCALFLTRHDSHCHDSLQNGTLKDYVKRHYWSWVQLARDRGYDDVRPILVSGFDSSQDYAMMAYAASDNQQSASVTVNVPNVASFWGNGWVTCTSRGSPHYNCGPRSESNDRTLEQEAPSESATQTTQNRYVTFVRGWHMMYRFFIFPKMQAAAEPKDLDPEDPDSEAGAEVMSNVLSENINPLDVAFKFLFQNSTADYALIHDDDLQQLSEIAFHYKESIEGVLERFHSSVTLVANDGVVSFISEHIMSWSKDALHEIHPPYIESTNITEYLDSVSKTPEGFERTTHVRGADTQGSTSFSQPEIYFEESPELFNLSHDMDGIDVPQSSDVGESASSHGESSNAGKSVLPNIIVPQRRYVPLSRWKSFAPMDTIYFTMQDGSMLKIENAFQGIYDGLVDPDIIMEFPTSSISIRIEWPGYASWTHQIGTGEFRVHPRPLTRARFGKQIGKCLKAFIKAMQSVPIDENHESWRVGVVSKSSITISKIALVGIEHVSANSWQPILYVDRA